MTNKEKSKALRIGFS